MFGRGSSLHRRIADNTRSDSVATRLRRKRFELLRSLLDLSLPRVRVLDIGGSQAYWDQMLPETDELSGRLTVTLCNIEDQAVSRAQFSSVIADARRLNRFSDDEFDLVFSNSTIEHVGTLEDQRRMAAEVLRLGRRYYVQTPNRYFPIEPHFVFPLFQFLPIGLRVLLLRRFDLGWIPRVPEAAQARALVESIRLLSRRELADLFPDARIAEERFAGLVKSLVAYSPAEPS
jgi:SAM-dependent methyltransferase